MVPDQVFCSFWTSNRTKENILFSHPITNNITNDTLIEEVVATKVEAVTIETISLRDVSGIKLQVAGWKVVKFPNWSCSLRNPTSDTELNDPMPGMETTTLWICLPYSYFLER
ncbi:hypothetical protein CEXT_658011 [Caerostris extrusa]|uniref:Uncharacterized protein n=1 Tax=Caerostris extrusa TaxID=172846 RepID=A0AAV4NN77_CAEEX|nr:hypothetical protein CEXT_658011 [Caerostris extrusa]